VRDDSRPAAENELVGASDGPAIRLPNGIVIQRRRLGRARVSQQDLLDVLRAIQQLPAADQNLIAQSGITLMLVPVAGLEGGLLGATTIVQDVEGSPWRPTVVRVAVSAHRRGSETTGEIVQHELGHVVSVLTNQDRSEEAAEKYARNH
jgi:hypothetical protein